MKKLDHPTIGELIDYLATVRKKMTFIITEDKQKGLVRITADRENYHVHSIEKEDITIADMMKKMKEKYNHPGTK
jgi:thioredoxin reductase